MVDNYFLNMIQNLRRDEGILLYNNILKIEAHQAKEVVAFLRQEYEDETLDYPYLAPDFDADAALWAAENVYIASQLILYRENQETDINLLLSDFDLEITPAAIISCDLCLRFLPDMLIQLKLIDYEDVLINSLERILTQWHYSGVKYDLDIASLDFTPMVTNNCLMQLYSNRIIEYKKISIAEHPVFKKRIAANLGMYGSEFWDDFKKITAIDE